MNSEYRLTRNHTCVDASTNETFEEKNYIFKIRYKKIIEEKMMFLKVALAKILEKAKLHRFTIHKISMENFLRGFNLFV